MSDDKKPSAAVQLLRRYLQEASAAELDAQWHAMRGLCPAGPTLSALMQSQRALATYLPLQTTHYDA